MQSILRPLLAISFLLAFAPAFAEGRPPHSENLLPKQSQIRNRDQLLNEVNAWMKKHHQPTWTMDELIGRSFDQAYAIYFIYNDSPLEGPVEPFLVSLIENQPFTREVRLRSNRRYEIALHTAEGEIDRLRLAWEQVRKNRKDWSDVDNKSANAPRRIPLPPHYTLSLDIFARTTKQQGKESSDDSNRACIFLASALVEAKRSSNVTRESRRYSSTSAATPRLLLDGINRWRHAHHQPQIGLDALTVRVADEIFNLREAQNDFWERDNELFLESIAKNAPFIYPASIETDEPATPGEPASFKMLSINKRLPLPLRRTVSMEISGLPDDLKTEEPSPRIDHRRIIISYAFPSKNSELRSN